MAAFFAILLGASAVLLGYFLYDFSRQIFIQETEAAIDIEIEHILLTVQGKDVSGRTQYIAERSKTSKHPIYLYQNSEEKILAGNMDEVPSLVTPISEGVISFSVKRGGVDRLIGAKIHTFADGSRLLIGREIHKNMQRYERLQLFSGLIIVFLLFVVLISFLISTFVVNRINLIADTAEKIMKTGDLSQRISINTKWDDLSNLAQILNAMLHRTEILMNGVRDVSDNIAHDLRTPLARLRGQLERAIETKLSRDEVDGLLIETDKILATFNALLRISNIEKGNQHYPFDAVDLQVVLEDVIELYEPLAEEKDIKIVASFTQSAPITAYRHLIFQMFANLLDNAIKYSPSGSTVSVKLRSEEGKGIVCIADQGIGIPRSDYQKVFDRFYRSDKSRNTDGSGLGLALVKAVLKLHEATIEFKDNNPGLVVEIGF